DPQPRRRRTPRPRRDRLPPRRRRGRCGEPRVRHAPGNAPPAHPPGMAAAGGGLAGPAPRAGGDGMIVAGIDPSLIRTGLSLIRSAERVETTTVTSKRPEKGTETLRSRYERMETIAAD